MSFMTRRRACGPQIGFCRSVWCFEGVWAERVGREGCVCLRVCVGVCARARWGGAGYVVQDLVTWRLNPKP